MQRSRVIYTLALFILAGCQSNERITNNFFIPFSCIKPVEHYLQQSYLYLQEAEISFERKDIKSVPLHLYGAKIFEISWLKNHEIEETVVAEINGIFSQCDLNDGVISFDLSQHSLNSIPELLKDKGPQEKVVIYLDGSQVEVFYSDTRRRQYNYDEIENP